MSFVAGPVRVAVPATSANLGPGFDSLGLALDLHDELTASVTDEGLVVEVEGEGAGTLALDESHLVVRSMWAGFAAMGVAPPGIRLQCRNAIPHARGLGSSSAAIVGGLGLARALVADGAALLPDADLVSLAADLEGHPDNVAPAALGGFTISGREGDRWYAVSAPVDSRVRAVVFVPPFALSTELARGLLPETVPHRRRGGRRRPDGAARRRAGRRARAPAGGDPRLPAPVLPPRRRCPTRSRWSTRCGPTGCRRSSPAPARRCSRSSRTAYRGWRLPTSLVARCPEGWVTHALGVDRVGVRVLPDRGGVDREAQRC